MPRLLTRTSVRVLTATLAGAALVVPATLPASAAPAPSPSAPIATGLAGPLGLAVGHHGTVYVAQSFSGTLTKIRHGHRRDIASEPGSDISGVAVGRHGRVAYTVTTFSGEPPEGSVVSAYVKRIGRNGKAHIVGDTWAYEQRRNPDQVNSYGFQDLTPQCAAQVPEEVGGGEPYTGLLDSHPYALAALRDGSYLVADAAANDILRVWPNGRIRTVAVLPPQPLEVTAELAQGQGLPKCTVGHVYNFEPVPTDVEVGPFGLLYVSTLPGGPEDPSLGARGSVYLINPWNGHARRLATGFLGAVDLAVSPWGQVYVAELFGNKISRVTRHGAQTVAEVTQPGAIEWTWRGLYATTDVFGDGSVVKIRLW